VEPTCFFIFRTSEPAAPFKKTAPTFVGAPLPLLSFLCIKSESGGGTKNKEMCKKTLGRKYSESQRI